MNTAPRYEAPRATLRARFKSLEMSFEDVSVKIGRAPGYLRDYLERGSPRALSYSDAIKLSVILNVPASHLLDVGDATPIPTTAADTPHLYD